MYQFWSIVNLFKIRRNQTMCFKMHSVDGVAVQMVRHWLTGSVVNRKAFWCWLTDSSEGASEPFDTHARVFCQRHWPWRNWLDVTYQTSLVTWRREKGRTTGSEVPLPRKSRLVGWGFVTLSQRNLQQCVFYLRRVCVCVRLYNPWHSKCKHEWNNQYTVTVDKESW